MSMQKLNMESHFHFFHLRYTVYAQCS